MVFQEAESVSFSLFKGLWGYRLKIRKVIAVDPCAKFIAAWSLCWREIKVKLVSKRPKISIFLPTIWWPLGYHLTKCVDIRDFEMLTDQHAKFHAYRLLCCRESLN